MGVKTLLLLHYIVFPFLPSTLETLRRHDKIFMPVNELKQAACASEGLFFGVKQHTQDFPYFLCLYLSEEVSFTCNKESSYSVWPG